MTLLKLVIFCGLHFDVHLLVVLQASRSVADRNIRKGAVQQLLCLQAMVRGSHRLELSSRGVCTCMCLCV